MQAKELRAGDQVRSTSGVVWAVKKVVRNDGMTYATGFSAGGTQFALAKKDHYDVVVVHPVAS